MASSCPSVFGLSALGVHVVGEIPAGLAPPKLPGITLDQWLSLIPGALALSLVVFAEAIGPARSFATKYRYSINPDQELIGLGAANVGAGLFQGFPIGSSLSKTAANDAAGAKSQMSGIVAAGLTILVALFLTPLFHNLPEATLAAIVVVAVYGMFKWREMLRLYKLRRVDFALALITFLGVLTFEEALWALLLAVVLSLLALVWRTSQGRMSELGLARAETSSLLSQLQPRDCRGRRAIDRAADLRARGEPLLRQRRHGAHANHQPAGCQGICRTGRRGCCWTWN